MKIGLAATLFLFALSLPANAQTASLGDTHATPFMRVFYVAEGPAGFYEFCARDPEGCRKYPVET